MDTWYGAGAVSLLSVSVSYRTLFSVITCPHIRGPSFGGCLGLSIELPCRAGTAPGPLTSLVVNTGGSEPAVWSLRAELMGKGVVNRRVSISTQGPFMYRPILLESCQSCHLLHIVLVSPRNALGLFHF